MKYYLDTEFIEDGKTIDLVSLALVAEDGREFYRQNQEAKFSTASDWVYRNVFPHLQHFDMSNGGRRACKEPSYHGGGQRLTGRCGLNGGLDCPWNYHWEIRDAVMAFCDIEKYGKPEFWGYFADYDWVAFCQLFGRMIDLPKGFQMYCNDIKQLCKSLGDPQLPKHSTTEHNALEDAHWNQEAHKFLLALRP